MGCVHRMIHLVRATEAVSNHILTANSCLAPLRCKVRYKPRLCFIQVCAPLPPNNTFYRVMHKTIGLEKLPDGVKHALGWSWNASLGFMLLPNLPLPHITPAMTTLLCSDAGVFQGKQSPSPFIQNVHSPQQQRPFN